MLCAWTVWQLNFAETAYHQGIDLYAENVHRFTSGVEFHASLMSDEPSPYHQPRCVDTARLSKLPYSSQLHSYEQTEVVAAGQTNRSTSADALG